MTSGLGGREEWAHEQRRAADAHAERSGASVGMLLANARKDIAKTCKDASRTEKSRKGDHRLRCKDEVKTQLRRTKTH